MKALISARAMANICEITGKHPVSGRNVSKANNRTPRRFLPNIQQKRFFSSALDGWVVLSVSTRAMRMIRMQGLLPTLRKALQRGTLAPRLVRLMKTIV